MIFLRFSLTNSDRVFGILLCIIPVQQKTTSLFPCSFCEKNVTFDGKFPISVKNVGINDILCRFVHELFIKTWYTFTICYKDDGDTAPFCEFLQNQERALSSQKRKERTHDQN